MRDTYFKTEILAIADYRGSTPCLDLDSETQALSTMLSILSWISNILPVTRKSLDVS